MDYLIGGLLSILFTLGWGLYLVRDKKEKEEKE